MNFEDGSLNHYAILGLPFGADFDLVKAMYKSMVKIYHPDIFVGDKKFAAQRLIELNASFEFLSDPKKKKAYDASLHPEDVEDETDFTETDNSFDDETSSLTESWKFACEYHPEIQGYYNNLKKLNKRSAFAFMAILVEQKLYADAEKIAQYLENEFLTSAFGDDKGIKDIGKAALLANERKYALELNHTLKKLGYASADQILTKLSMKYPEFGYDILMSINRYRRLIPQDHPRNSSKEKEYKAKQDKASNAKKENNADLAVWIKDLLKDFLIFLFCYFLFIFALVLIVNLSFVDMQRAFVSVHLGLPISILCTYIINTKLRDKKVIENWMKFDLTERKFLLPILIVPNLIPLFTGHFYHYLMSHWTVPLTATVLIFIYRYRLLKIALWLPILCYFDRLFLGSMVYGERFTIFSLVDLSLISYFNWLLSHFWMMRTFLFVG